MRQYTDLYKIERLYSNDSPEVRTLARNNLSRPIFEEMVKTIHEIRDGFDGRTPAWNAANYFLEREGSLSRFLDDGRYPIDNNRAELSAKKFVMGRKNFLLAQSAEEARTAAGYMTLLVSAQQNGLNPFDYLTYVLSELSYFKDQENISQEVIERLVPYSSDLPVKLKVDKK